MSILLKEEVLVITWQRQLYDRKDVSFLYTIIIKVRNSDILNLGNLWVFFSYMWQVKTHYSATVKQRICGIPIDYDQYWSDWKGWDDTSFPVLIWITIFVSRYNTCTYHNHFLLIKKLSFKKIYFIKSYYF